MSGDLLPTPESTGRCTGRVQWPKSKKRKQRWAFANSFCEGLRRGRFSCPSGNGHDGRSVKEANINLMGWVTHVTNILQDLCKGLSCKIPYGFIPEHTFVGRIWVGCAHVPRGTWYVLIIRKKLFWHPFCILCTNLDGQRDFQPNNEPYLH